MRPAIVLLALLPVTQSFQVAKATANEVNNPNTEKTRDQEFKKTPRENPTCDFKPSLDFLDELAPGTSREHLTSAAWFARAVQLDNEQRTAAWKSLSQAPLSIHDLYAGPFGMHASVLEFEKQILVMYRGTQDPLDYVLNAFFYTTPGWIHNLPGWVHKGFLTNFGMTWHQLRRKLKTLTETGKDVVFASHSLGGAMSQYAAMRLEKEGIHVGRIYAFQSPNAGDKTFKREFDKRFSGRAFNVVYGKDVTPFIPPSRDAVRAFVAASTRPLAGTLGLIARTANYAALEGRMRLESDGYLREGWDEEEMNFWDGYRSHSGGKGFPLGLSGSSDFVRDHNIGRVLCALAKEAQH